MVAKKTEDQQLKGGSPYATEKQEILDRYGIKDVSPVSVYIIDRQDEGEHIIIRKPIGKDLSRTHLEIMLELQGDEPLREFDPSTGYERILPSPTSKNKQLAAMENWIENVLPGMLLYPKNVEDLTYGEQFSLFTIVFTEVDHANKTFRLLR